MRILHVAPTYWPAVRYGGPIYSVHELCKALHAAGHEVHVFTTNVDGSGNTDVPLGRSVDVDGVKVWYFRSRVGRRLYYSPAMRSALEEQTGRFDIVHTHSVFLWPTWAAAKAARRAGVPYIVSPRGMLLRDLIRRKSRWRKTLWIHLIESGNLKYAARVHVTADTERSGLEELGLELAPVVTIPNGVILAAKASVAEVSGDVEAVVKTGRYVLYLGRINWKKGLDRLVELWRERKDVRLVIAGNDEERYKERLIRAVEKRNMKNVDFIPRFISGADKEYLMENAVVFVLPSYSENFGNAALEALAHGVPVIVTQEVGCREIIETSGGGLALPFDRFDAGIDDLLADSRKRDAMGREGRAFVAERLGWEHVAAEMVRVYREMIPAA